MSSSTALIRLSEWPRLQLANLPTPIRPLPRLAEALGGPTLDLLVKLDSETGFALGGNKVRKLEFELAPERLKGVTCLITAGGPQSNHCRVTAAAAAQLGLRCVLIVNGSEPETPTGNALLHRLFGAEIVTVPERQDRIAHLESTAVRIGTEGGHPLVIPIGASTGLGSLGYVVASAELFNQLGTLKSSPERTVVFVASSSCGTLAGLLLGISLLELDDVLLVGVSADMSAIEIEERSTQIAREGADLLGWNGTLLTESITAIDDQVGGGYGLSTAASDEALRMFALHEGLVLDPTYTAKAAAGLISWMRTDMVSERDRVVFLHTGGHPGLLT
ncbi:MAG TPA: pyridoxal-phosphate dependent enzyme [Gemmatimonadetes bacterium]|nr:pyridoxal-phosphate dependent enzyme [Gemmatimonadota bacterium]